MKLNLFTDGGSRGNPGPAAYGFVVYSHAGIILEKCGNYLGQATNNVAEYEGLLAGLNWIVANRPGSEVDIYLDSLLVVNQVKGVFKIKNDTLRSRLHQIHALLARLDGYTISYVPRDQNAVADSLVNEALDRQLLRS